MSEAQGAAIMFLGVGVVSALVGGLVAAFGFLALGRWSLE